MTKNTNKSTFPREFRASDLPEFLYANIPDYEAEAAYAVSEMRDYVLSNLDSAIPRASEDTRVAVYKLVGIKKLKVSIELE